MKSRAVDALLKYNELLDEELAKDETKGKEVNGSERNGSKERKGTHTLHRDDPITRKHQS